MPSLRPVLNILSLLVFTLGLAMLLPALFELGAENGGWEPFLASSAVTITVAGSLFLSTRGGNGKLGVRQAFLLTTLSWFSLCAFAALPFVFAELEGVDYADAFFEAASGLTTTGSTVLAGLDHMPHGILLWRGLMQWLGGVGVIVMAVAILPFLQVGGMQLFRAESSERSQITLRAGDLSKRIVQCYLLLSLLCTLAYWAAGMELFDAVVHMMATVSTGGYSTSDGSLGNWPQPAVQWTAVVFMIAGALPFLLYVQALRGRPGSLLRDPQVRLFMALLAGVVLFAAWRLWMDGRAAPSDALTLATFNVVSIITTTGFTSTDYTLWGDWAVVLFFFLMFLGGCSGSTSGSIKTYRLYVLLRAAEVQLKRLTHPNGVQLVLYEGRQVDERLMASVAGFVMLFFGTVALLTVALAAMGLDFVTAISAAATAVSNVGPGLGDIVGPAGNFVPLPDAAKWLLSLGMLLGRLELFTVLVLLLPQFWRG